MKVLLAAKHLHFPQGGGGLERNTHELCLRLIQHGVQPAVMCNLQPDGSLLSLANRLSRKLRPSIRFPVDTGLGYPVFRGWGGDDGAREVARRFEPDVVVAQSGEPVPLLQSFEGLGIPRMAYFHEVERIEDVAVLARMPSIGLLANSTFTARKMQAISGVAPTVVRPLIDPDFYVTSARGRNVLFVNTRPRKGLEVAFRLAELRHDVQFDFVKSWILTPAETRQIEARAKAAGNIALHPPRNDMRALYARARLLLAPSQWEEAWGRVATEAQINGIPVLASDRGGLPESVGPGGVLAPHDASMEVWQDAFSRIWDHEDRYRHYSEQALAYSKRPEIQPNMIVRTFVRGLETFLQAGQEASLHGAGLFL
jgi:glycosyltransferase involved in cell wall biosynthesis